MASENVDDWDQPLPSCSSEVEEETDGSEDRRQKENIKKLQSYVEKMCYRPVPPPPVGGYTKKLAKPKKMVLTDNYEQFHNIVEPKLRGKRMKTLAGKYSVVSTEQLESIIKNQKAKERKKEDVLQRKQEIYYELLIKLERQCRVQYLEVLVKKFANFISKLATTMRIPDQLVEPYARMQRTIFCNIVKSIGVQPTNQASYYYNTPEAQQYELCHKLSHALLSLIIKALDAASSRKPEDMKPLGTDFEMDNYIRNRLMCAANKKIRKTKSRKPTKTEEAFKKCNL